MDSPQQPNNAPPLLNGSGQMLPSDLSDTWKARFTLLEKAGGTKMPKAKDLSFGERNKLVFNIWGMLFAPFYYLKLGMWKKAISYSVLGVLGIVLIEMLCRQFNINGGSAGMATNFVLPAIFATRANVDYYKKLVLGSNGWF